MQTFAPKEDISFVHIELWKWNRSSAGSKVVGHSDDFIYVEQTKLKLNGDCWQLPIISQKWHWKDKKPVPFLMEIVILKKEKKDAPLYV